MTPEEAVKKHVEEKSLWDRRHDHQREVRAARRGWPPPEDRPKCLGCDRLLSPDWKYEKRENDDPRSSETDVLRGWEGYGNVFCTARCAISYALATPAARAARVSNVARIAPLNAQRGKR